MPNAPPIVALIVMADQRRRSVLLEPLRNAGFEVRIAGDGAEGLRLASDVPDIVVLDLRLPDMSGFEVCCRLKAHTATAGIPVLHLSDTPVESRELAGHLEQGDEAYLTYPVQPAELLAAAKTLLRSRQAQLQFSNFLADVPDAVVIVDHDGTIVRVNGQAEQMFGHLRKDLLGQTIEMLVPERFRAAHQQRRAEYMVHPGPRRMATALKLWGLRKDRSEFPVEISLSPILGHDGIHVASVVRDVTEQRQIEQSLAESEVRYRRLFETAKDGILILDTKTGRIADANPFMCDLLGFAYDDFIGKEPWEIGLFSDKAANEAAVRALHANGYVRYEDLPLETKDGRRVEVEVVANIYEAGGAIVAQCNIRDISERSRLEQSLKEQKQALADLYRRKDEFLAMLSHELRSPLAPISNAVHLLNLRKNAGDAAQQKACAIIERQVNQMTRLIDDLMEVSRITTGQIHLQQQRVPLHSIVEDAVETVRSLIEQRKHELNVSLSPQSLWLYADATRLVQVLVNLLINAAKYTADGGTISLTTHREGEEVVLRVRDTGVGIAADLLPHVFDLFTQAHRSLDRSQGGLGIGLALVRRLVELHGGTVTAVSRLGEGSEFAVRLPIMAMLPDEPQAERQDAAKPNGPSLRVLVVDDSVDTAESLAMLLQECGHEVRIAHDGPTALEMAVDCRPQIVLLDIGLPGFDGFEVAKRVRQEPSLDHTVLVAMTGYGQESDRQRSRDAGFDHHLSKPADFGDVQQILATIAAKSDL